jgi:hypothetical protein
MVCRKDDYREAPGANINLKTKISVRRYYRLETGPFRRVDQIPVRQRRPPHFRGGTGIMAREQVSQGARHILVEKNPHYGVALCRS